MSKGTIAELRVALKLMYPGAVCQFTTQEAKERVQSHVLGSCHDHSEFDVERIDTVLVSYCDDGKDYADSESAFLFLLKDGKYAVAWENSDSSGHG